jgi:hypothetical protein
MAVREPSRGRGLNFNNRSTRLWTLHRSRPRSLELSLASTKRCRRRALCRRYRTSHGSTTCWSRGPPLRTWTRKPSCMTSSTGCRRARSQRTSAKVGPRATPTSSSRPDRPVESSRVTLEARRATTFRMRNLTSRMAPSVGPTPKAHTSYHSSGGCRASALRAGVRCTGHLVCRYARTTI